MVGPTVKVLICPTVTALLPSVSMMKNNEVFVQHWFSVPRKLPKSVIYRFSKLHRCRYSHTLDRSLASSNGRVQAIDDILKTRSSLSRPP